MEAWSRASERAFPMDSDSVKTQQTLVDSHQAVWVFGSHRWTERSSTGGYGLSLKIMIQRLF